MLIASVVLIAPILLTLTLERLKVIDLHNEEVHADLSAAKIGGHPFAGFKMFITNPFLLAIGAFIFLYTAVGSFVYFEQKNLLAMYVETRDERAVILAQIDLAVNILTFVIGMFATSRIVNRLGMPATLALVPVFIVAKLIRRFSICRNGSLSSSAIGFGVPRPPVTSVSSQCKLLRVKVRASVLNTS